MLLDHDALDAAYDGSWDMPDNSPHLAHVRALAGVQRAVVHLIAVWLRDQAAHGRWMESSEGYEGEALCKAADELEAK